MATEYYLIMDTANGTFCEFPKNGIEILSDQQSRAGYVFF